MNDGTGFCPNCGQKQGQAANGVPPQTDMNQNSVSPTYQTQPQAQPYIAPPVVRQKKKRGCLTAFIVVLIILGLGAAALYFFLPGLFTPNDLGIKSSRAAYESTMDKLGMRKDASPTTGSAEDYVVTYDGLHAVETNLSSEELTSFFNENRPPYYAVKAVQVRVNEDGSIEASAKLDTNYVFNTILNGAYTREDAKAALPMVGLIPENVNVYFKLTGSVVNNQIQGLDVEAVKIMGIGIPQSLISSATPFIVQTLDGYISRETNRTGTSIALVEARNGELDFKGTLPSSVSRIPAE